MATVPPTRSIPDTSTETGGGSQPLRLRLANRPGPGRPDGVWWPRSRDLAREVRDLVDHFPPDAGRIDRLLFSRPDWDAAVVDGRGVRSVRVGRGKVKTGSFPADDTRLVTLVLASRQRLELRVVQSATDQASAQALLDGVE